MLSSVYRTWGHDSFWQSDKEGQPQTVSMLSICYIKLDILILLLISNPLKTGYKIFSRSPLFAVIQKQRFSTLVLFNNISFCLHFLDRVLNIAVCTFCLLITFLSLSSSCAHFVSHRSRASPEYKLEKKKLKMPKCFPSVWFRLDRTQCGKLLLRYSLLKSCHHSSVTPKKKKKKKEAV